MRARIPGSGFGDVYGRCGVPTPSFRFSKGYDEQAVQFFVIEVPDGIRQVLGQDMTSFDATTKCASALKGIGP